MKEHEQRNWTRERLRGETMPFNDFERRAEELNKTQNLETRLLVKDLLFEVHRLRNKLSDIRHVLASEDYLT